MVIYLGRRLPGASCGLPERNSETGYLSRSYSALLQMGFTVPRSSPSRAVGSYPTVSPLPAARIITPAGGLFSVALSIGSPRLGVTQHFALWSSDFPHPKRDATIRPACKANQRINDGVCNDFGWWAGYRLFVYSRFFYFSAMPWFASWSASLFSSRRTCLI